jgi:hypothetical protein
METYFYTSLEKNDWKRLVEPSGRVNPLAQNDIGGLKNIQEIFVFPNQIERG